MDSVARTTTATEIAAAPAHRSRAAWWLLLTPWAAELALDLSRRADALCGMHARELLGYARSCAVSCALAGSLLWLHLWATRRGHRVWCVASQLSLWALSLLLVAAQSYTFARYHAYLDEQAVLLGTALLPSVGQQLWHDKRGVLAVAALPLLLATALPWWLGARAATPSTRSAARARDVLVLALVFGAFGGKVERQLATPSALYLHAMGQAARSYWNGNQLLQRRHPGPREPLQLPALAAAPARPRNVILLLSESIRADALCDEPAAPCDKSPGVQAAAPERVSLKRTRAVASTTAISIATLWSGYGADMSREQAHSVPLLWDYVHAAGLDSGYFTSQNLLFGNSGVWLQSQPFTRHLSATHLEHDAPLEVGASDATLLARALDELGQLREPYVAVLHLSNTHFPYRVPQALERSHPDEAADPVARYHLSVRAQDLQIADFLRALRGTAHGGRAVVLFTSDHGEQLFERGAHGHTGSVYDEEVHVPMWLDAPAGTLTDDERAQLLARREQPLFNDEVLPTLLDLAGLWPSVQALDAGRGMAGGSWLRAPRSPRGAVLLSNCAGIWACAFRNWGASDGRLKVLASQADRDWACFDLASDPQERQPLPAARCAQLLPTAERLGKPFADAPAN